MENNGKTKKQLLNGLVSQRHRMTEEGMSASERTPTEGDPEKHRQREKELVDEDTAELKGLNKQLQQEVAQRQRAEAALKSFQADLQAKNESLKTLNAIADKVYGSLDLQTVAERAVAALMNYSQSSFVGIFAVHEAPRCLEALHCIGFNEEARLAIAKIPPPADFHVITIEQPDTHTSETMAHDNRIESPVQKLLLNQGLQRAIVVPLRFQDRTIGIIFLGLKKQIPPLTDLERETLMNMGKAIGLAMANAQYVAQIETEIRERKKAENLLQSGKEIFYSTLQEAPNGVALIGKNGKYLYLNSEFTHITGYTLKDIPTGIDWFRKAYPNPRYRHEVIERWKKDLATRKTFDGVFSVVCKDGAAKEIEFKGTVLKGGRIITMLSDITTRVQAEDELEESEARYRTLFDCAADATFVHDLDGRFLDVNTVACERYGYEKEEFLRMTPQDITTPGRAKNISQRVEEIKRQGYVLYETVHLRRDGMPLPTEISSQIIEYRGRPVILSTARDITERKQAEEALRESEARLRKLFEAIPEAVMVHDEEGYILHINDVGAKRLEWPMEELVGKNLREIVKPENAALISEHVKKARTTGSCIFETTYVAQSGRYIVAEVNERPIELEGKNVILSVARDITERKRAEQQLAYIATHDSLTDLPNRLMFNDRLALALAQAHRHQHKLAVMLLDLDRFKDINDTLGHSVGDQLLRVVSKRLKTLLRKSDTLARMGGDEFLFLLTDIVRPEHATEVARKIIESFGEPFRVEDHELRTTASMGITIFPDDGDDADVLLKNADIAMYQAKHKGRNNFQQYTATIQARPLM